MGGEGGKGGKGGIGGKGGRAPIGGYNVVLLNGGREGREGRGCGRLLEAVILYY